MSLGQQNNNYLRINQTGVQNNYGNQPYPSSNNLYPNVQQGQPQPIYNQPYYNQNNQYYGQYAPQPGFPQQQQGNLGFLDNVKLQQNARTMQCICITVVVENILYLINALVYSGTSCFSDFGFWLMFFQVILFGLYMGKFIENGMTTDAHRRGTYKAFVVLTVIHMITFIVLLCLIWFVFKDYDVDDDVRTAFMIWYGISAFIYLLPRFIVICVVQGKHKD